MGVEVPLRPAGSPLGWALLISLGLHGWLLWQFRAWSGPRLSLETAPVTPIDFVVLPPAPAPKPSPPPPEAVAPAAKPAQPPVTPQPIKPQTVAPAKPATEPSPEPEPLEPPPPIDTRPVVETYDPLGTSPAEGFTNLGAWMAQLPPGQPPPKRFPLTLAYPDKTCAADWNQASPPSFGVLLDENGRPAGEIALLQSSGYARLNRAGREAVLAHIYPENRANQALLVDIQWIDACPTPPEVTP
ncbi:MAG: hypothetical protein IGQ88_02465 [Gloeomargaritaceae cyanobacterium C42_A2020_066]|nr:hypothetical protein [Gloeomargaritaceae cyanobacterium C42_A2020_066]